MRQDKTLLFQEILSESLQKVPNRSSDKERRESLSKKESDNFVKEAKSTLIKVQTLKTYLSDNRTKYCQAVQIYGMSNKEKEDLDSHAGQFVRACMERISLLKSIADEKEDSSVKTHLQSIVLYLNKALAEVSKYQKEMQEIRLQQQKEMHKSYLHSVETSAVELEEIDRVQSIKEVDLSNQERILLEQENQTLLNEFEERETERSVDAISKMQEILEHHIAVQAKEIEYIYDEAIDASDKVRQGNKQLLQAKERNSDFRKYVLLILLLASFVLLFLDWYG